MPQPPAPLSDLVRRAVVSIAVTSAVLLVLLVAGPFAITAGACVTPGLDKFDATLWRFGDHDLPCGTRSRMAEDVVSHRLSVGMTKQQVTELLGEPANPSDSVWEARTRLST
jgi:hypothetical protein